MRYTVPHNVLTLNAFLDTTVPLVPTSFVLRNIAGALGNGINFEIGLPSSQIKSLLRYQIQISTVLWPDDAENVTALSNITHTNTDGTITQGGTTLTTLTDLTSVSVGDLIYTHEGINLTTGVITFPAVFTISGTTDLGGGVWEITIANDDVFKLRKGAPGVGGTVTFYVSTGWKGPNNPTTWIDSIQPFFGSSFGTGDPESSTTQNAVLYTAETVFARARLRNFEGWGPYLYWDGSTGTTTKASAVAFTPGHMQGPAFDDGSVTAVKQSKGTIPATVNINMQADDQDTVSWSAGSVAWADGTTETISAVGSPLTLGPGIIYVFKLTGNSTLQFSSVFSNAVGNDRTYLGQIIVASPPVVGEFATVFLFGDINGPTLTSAVGAFGKLSALTADLGAITAGTLDAITITTSTITGGTFRTAASGVRVQLTAAGNDRIEWTNSLGVVVANMQWQDSTKRLSIFNSTTGSVRITTSGGVFDFFDTGLFMFNKDLVQADDVQCNSLQKNGAGPIVVKDIFEPISNNGIDLGTSGKNWAKFWVDRIDCAGNGTFGTTESTHTFGIQARVNSPWTPDIDNNYVMGTASKRWADVRSVLINGADIGLENNWKMREWPCSAEDVQNKSSQWMRENANLGIQFVDDDENVIAVLHKDGFLYCRGVKRLENLRG